MCSYKEVTLCLEKHFVNDTVLFVLKMCFFLDKIPAVYAINYLFYSFCWHLSACQMLGIVLGGITGNSVMKDRLHIYHLVRQ